MFCSQCGNENQLEARFCQKCGNSLSGVPGQPKSNVKSQGTESAIWNPNATANWSLIFSPAFGSYLQMLNWRALGEHEKAASSQNWFYVSLGMLAVYVFMGVFMDDSKAADVAARGLGFFFLIGWYFSVGRAQSKYVKEKFGSGYARKPWSKALLIGIAALVGFFIAAAIVGLVLGIAR
jgi:zinc-ribbon domain